MSHRRIISSNTTTDPIPAYCEHRNHFYSLERASFEDDEPSDEAQATSGQEPSTGVEVCAPGLLVMASVVDTEKQERDRQRHIKDLETAIHNQSQELEQLRRNRLTSIKSCKGVVVILFLITVAVGVTVGVLVGSSVAVGVAVGVLVGVARTVGVAVTVAVPGLTLVNSHSMKSPGSSWMIIPLSIGVCPSPVQVKLISSQPGAGTSKTV